MIDDISMRLIQSIIDSQKNIIVIFSDDEEVILLNKEFKKFVNVSSVEQYKEVFEKFTDHFVPHPLYFNAEKIISPESWFDAVEKLEEMDKVVSILSHDYLPYAFSIDINSDVDGYKIVTLRDITQTLIKRLMIENKTNMDSNSGAYSKQYFLNIIQSYEDAASFNERTIAMILINIKNLNLSDDKDKLSEFVNYFKNIIRQDDMLVRWENDIFLLNFFVDKEENSKIMLEKLNNAIKNDIKCVKCRFTLGIKTEKESVRELIDRISETSCST